MSAEPFAAGARHRSAKRAGPRARRGLPFRVRTLLSRSHHPRKRQESPKGDPGVLPNVALIRVPVADRVRDRSALNSRPHV